MPRFGLLARIGLGLAAVSLVPLAVLSHRLYTLDRDAMREQVQRTHAVAARATAARVEAFLATEQRAAAALAGNRQLDDPASPAAAELLASTLEVAPGILAAVVQDAVGVELVRAQRPGSGPRVAALLARASAPPALLAEPPAPDGTTARWLAVAAPRPAGGRVVLLVDGAPLAGFLAPEELGPQAQLLLLDAGAAPLLTAGAAVALPPAVAELARHRAVSGAQVVDRGDGSEVVAALWPVSGAPWTVATLQPASVAEALARTLRQRILLAFGVALLLAGGLVLVAWRSLVKPLRGMLAAQAELGLLSARQREGGEVSQLQESFARLGERVRQQKEVGRVFLGRYQVLGVLGEGGMGIVFRGWDAKLQRPVALKTLRVVGEEAEVERRRLVSGLLREAVSGARFNHSHIVAVYDLEHTAEAAYVAMELVEGQSLDQYPHARAPLLADEVAAVGAAVSSALAAAHGKGLIHRDIKPGNVLLGHDGAIKVADFGIAAFMSSLRESGDWVFGTPGFLAPESVRGRGYSPASDVFGCGALLYTIATGNTPFTGRDPHEIMVATALLDAPPLPQDVGLPPELAATIERMLAKEPDARPTAQAAADALADVVRGKVVRWRFDPRPPGEPAPLAEPLITGWLPTIGVRLPAETQ